MSEEIKEALKIAIELIIFGIILLIISTFNTYSRIAFVEKNNQDAIKTDISEYRLVYEYTMGKETTKENLKLLSCDLETNYANLVTRVQSNDSMLNLSRIASVVTGDDIVRLVAKYPRKYNVFIYTKSNKTDESYILTPLSSDEAWDMLSVHSFLGTDIVENFYCIFVYDSDLSIYESVVFIKQTNKGN